MQLVRSIVDLAHNLCLTAIAEGVERPVELSFLHKIGCDLAQGYLFSKPLPSFAIEALLRIKPATAPIGESIEVPA